MQDQHAPAGRSHWLWVTRPEYYLDENGVEVPHLQPGSGGGWWTCHQDTRQGDLVMLYRSQDKKDIAHLLVARSDAFTADDPSWEFHGKPVCDYEVVERFASPVSFSSLWNDPALRSSWPALATKFVKSGTRIPDDAWTLLGERLGVDLTQLARRADDGLHRVRLERQIQAVLADRLDLWAAAGWPRLQFVAKERRFSDGGRADLVFTQRRPLSRTRTVVVELKRGKITKDAVDQVLRYRQHLRGEDRRVVSGRAIAIVAGRDITDEARKYADRMRVTFVDLTALSVAVEGSSVRVEPAS